MRVRVSLRSGVPPTSVRAELVEALFFLAVGKNARRKCGPSTGSGRTGLVGEIGHCSQPHKQMRILKAAM